MLTLGRSRLVSLAGARASSWGVLPGRKVVVASGPDAHSFLHGTLTLDMETGFPPPGGTRYSALLSSKGKMLFDLFVSPLGPDSYALDVEAQAVAPLIRVLSRYKLRSDVTLTPSPAHAVRVALPSDGVMLDPDHIDPRSPEMGWRKVEEVGGGGEGEEDQLDDVSHAYAARRLALGLPEGWDDYPPNKALAPEMSLDSIGKAISLTKGCYIGQELIARTYARGEIRKRILPLYLASAPEDLPSRHELEIMTPHELQHGIDGIDLETTRLEPDTRATLVSASDQGKDSSRAPRPVGRIGSSSLSAGLALGLLRLRTTLSSDESDPTLAVLATQDAHDGTGHRAIKLYARAFVPTHLRDQI